VRRSGEDVELIVPLKLKFILLSDVGVVGDKRLLSVCGISGEKEGNDNQDCANLKCAGLPLPLGEGWGEGAKLSC